MFLPPANAPLTQDSWVIERERVSEDHEVSDPTMIHFPIPETFDSEKLKWPYDGAQGWRWLHNSDKSEI